MHARSFVGSALVLAACTSTPSSVHLDGAEYCARLASTLTEGASRCCGAIGPAPTLASLEMSCLANLSALVDDPRTGFDSVAAVASLDAAHAALATCQLDTARQLTSGDLRRFFAGSRPIGAPCVDATMVRDAASDLSCEHGYCSLVLVDDEYRCEPLAVEGGACGGAFACNGGLYCEIPSAGSTGACQRLRSMGAACTSDVACASSLCLGGTCAQQDTSFPQQLCNTPLPVVDRALDVHFVGLAESETRDVHVRVLDATDAAVLSVQFQGVRGAWATEHVPHALAESTRYLAQVWTSDRADPSGETWSFETMVPAGSGTVTLEVDVSAPTTPLTVMLPPSFDASFDVQTFDFDAEIGHPFWLRLTSRGRTSAQARLYAIPDVMFEVTVPDALVPGEDYEIVLVVDVNEDGVYQSAQDHGWLVHASAPLTGGLSIPYPWSSEWRDVGF